MTTLRQIIELIGDEFMDAELTIRVADGNLNSEHMDIPLDYNRFFRSKAWGNKDYGQPAYLRFDVFLEEHRLVKRSKK